VVRDALTADLGPLGIVNASFKPRAFLFLPRHVQPVQCLAISNMRELPKARVTWSILTCSEPVSKAEVERVDVVICIGLASG